MDVGQILLGGSVTLAGTVAVQLYVIPHVQARTRGWERWENDMRELAALIEEELPRAIDAFRWAGYDVRQWGETQRDPDFHPAKVEAALVDATGEFRQANAALGEQMARVKILVARVKRRNPEAWYWRQLQIEHMKLQRPLWDVPGHKPGAPDLDDEQYDKVWVGVEAARKRMLDKLNEKAARIPMKPPSQHRIRRAWRSIRASDGRDLLAGP